MYSSKFTLSSIIAAALLMLAAHSATAQSFQPFGDLHHTYDLEVDYQLFSPPIIDEYGGETIEANIGPFFEYNRFYLNLSNPETSPTPFQGDWTWGNRFDFGYMTPERHGWLVSVWRMNGTNNVRTSNATDIQGNAVVLTNNINNGQFGGVEVNKTFRSHPYPYEHKDELGVYHEPFFGIRFGRFTDDVLQQALVFDNVVTPMVETASSTRGQWENNMLGVQFGDRLYIRRGHWILSAEGRAFGLHNHQFFSARNTTVVTNADGMGGFNVQNPVIQDIDEDFDEFVVGGEVRIEAAYEITREVRLQAGFQWLYFGRGIARGFDPVNNTGGSFNDQAQNYTGITIGFEINR